jgi:hypothetical protein
MPLIAVSAPGAAKKCEIVRTQVAKERTWWCLSSKATPVLAMAV